MYTHGRRAAAVGHERMSAFRRVQPIVTSHSSAVVAPSVARRHRPNGQYGWFMALIQRLLGTKRPAPLALVGHNANGKTSAAESFIKDGMLSNDEYEGIRDSVEPEESLYMEHEAGRQDAVPCDHDGTPLLSDAGYHAPTPIDPRFRRDKLAPVLPDGDSTRATTAYTWGTRLQACIIYIGQADVSDAVGYLRKINAALRSDRDRNPQHALPPGAGQNVVYDIVKLRLGLGLIRKKIVLNSSDHRVGVDGGNAVLNTVRDLQPEEITIPRQLWELAGTVQWFYPDHSRPLSEQLDQLSEFLWRNTTCHREEEDSSDDGVTGNQHLSYVAGVLVKVPSRNLQDVLLLDHVGYIPEDTQCTQSYSQLMSYAGNIVAVSEARGNAVNRALELLETTRLLPHLAAGRPNTPHVLMLMPAEKTTELAIWGQELSQAIDALVQHGTAAELRSCLQTSKLWLQQYAEGSPLSQVEALTRQGTAGSLADKVVQCIHMLLQQRKKNERGWLDVAIEEQFRSKQDACRQAAALLRDAAGPSQGPAAAGRGTPTRTTQPAASSSQDRPSPAALRRAVLAEAGVFSLAWWPHSYSNIKMSLERQQHLGPELIQEACSVLSEVTGVASMLQFVHSSKVRWEDKHAAAVIEDYQETSKQVRHAVPFTVVRVLQDMLVCLRGSAGSAASADAVIQAILSNLDDFKVSAHSSIKRLKDSVVAAMQVELSDELAACTPERALAEGICMFLGDRKLTIPSWQQQLGFDVDPPAGRVVGPAEYSPAVWEALKGLRSSQRHLTNWLQGDHAGNSLNKENENVTKTPAHCLLSPLREAFASVLHRPFITPAQQQRQQHQHQNQHVLSAQGELQLIAAGLASALQPPAGLAGTADCVILLRELEMLKSHIPGCMTRAFVSLSDLVQFMCPAVMQVMTERLYLKVVSLLVSAHGCQIPQKMKLLAAKSQELKDTMLQAIDEAVDDALAKHWETFLQLIEDHITRPVSFFMSNQRQRLQQIQQSGGLCKAVREVIELRCFMLMDQGSDSSSREGRQPSAAGPSNQASHSSTSTAAQLQLPTAIAQVLLEDPDEFWDTTLDDILPQPSQLQQLASKLLHLARQHKASFRINSSVQQLLHCPNHEWLPQCAAQLSVQDLPAGISPIDAVQLWLAALPPAATIQELEHALCSTADAGTTATYEHAGPRAEPAATAAVTGDARAIGSEGHTKLLTQCVEEGILPWPKSDLCAVVEPELSRLISDGFLVPGQLISSLPYSTQLQIGEFIYMRAYKLPPKPERYNLNRRIVDAIVTPDRVELDVSAAADDAEAADSTAAMDTASSVVDSFPADRVYTSSSGQKLLRVSATPLKSVQGRRAKHLLLPVAFSTDSSLAGSRAVVKLDRDTEFLLCETRVEHRLAGPLPPAVLSKLNAQAPIAVLLAAARIIQDEQQQQQQQQILRAQASTPGRDGLQQFNVLKSYSLLWDNRLKAALKCAKVSKDSTSTPDTVILPEMLLFQNWDILESVKGVQRFYYTGPLPQQLLEAPGSSSSSSSSRIRATVAFDDFSAVLAFIQKGTLHHGLKYLATKHHRDLMKTFDKATGGNPRTDAGQQADARVGTVLPQPANPSPPASRPAVAPAARTGRTAAAAAAAAAASTAPVGGSGRSSRPAARPAARSRRLRSADHSSAATAAAAAAARATEAAKRTGSPVRSSSSSKRYRAAAADSGGTQPLTVGEVVAATDDLKPKPPAGTVQTGPVCGQATVHAETSLIVTMSFATDKKKKQVRLSAEGAYMKAEDFYDPAAARGDCNLRRLDNDSLSPWLGPITRPSHLVKHATGLKRRGWRDIYDYVTGEKRSWEPLKNKVEQEAAAAAAAAVDSDDDHDTDCDSDAEVMDEDQETFE